ncbi:ScbA/BarX family gamma-butyrolactone biosynthesis protein [Streptacidiphilus melanogenes]|uniref:ScbA/BarX family gamma-butyrolactone biosynthesis protein n=1 Tax=Streptacidiphilus melanogenes TaxID=411235 RepID=UPI0005A98335|nr:ScbA/BarX family gamma-butyrolactone biosynthesis protein [Streptacidiphilus melanogenes]
MLGLAQARRNDVAAASPPLTATVPREYVHRASVAEVLLTGWGAAPDGDRDAFVVRAQWPRRHALFTPALGLQDPMLLAESVRQAGLLLSHAEYHVPFGHQFLMWDLSFAATPAAFTAGPTPTDVELRTVCRDIVRRGRTIAAMRYEVTVLRAGRPVATGGARFSCTSDAVHRRMRAGRPVTTGRPLPVPVDPASVGRATPQDVLLAAAPAPVAGAGAAGAGAAGAVGHWELRVDTDHPIFFDHPVDHVPGMLLLEAARQAARAVTRQPGAVLLGMESSFLRYAELDAPCRLEARIEPGAAPRADRVDTVRVRVSATQHGEQVFRADLLLGRPND